MLNQSDIEETFKSLGLTETPDIDRILSLGKISSEKTETMQYKISTDSNTDRF